MDYDFQIKLLRAYLGFAKTDLAIALAEKRTLEEFLWRLNNGLTTFEESLFIIDYL